MRRPAPAAAVRRRATSTPARWSRARLELRPRDARRARGRSTRPRTAPRAVPGRPAADARDAPLVELDDLVRFVGAPGPRVPAPAARDHASATSPTSSRTRCRSSSTRWTRGASASGCSTPRLAGAEPARRVRAEIARGTLPPGQLGRPVDRATCCRSSRRSSAARGAGRASRVGRRPGRVPDGRSSPAPCRACAATCCATVNYSRVNPRHRLAAWVRLLALTAAHPERPFAAVTIGRAQSGRTAQVTVARVAAARAPTRARSSSSPSLLDLYDRGMREPLPLACPTSAAYARRRARGRRPGRAARAWESRVELPRARTREPEHQLVFGGVRTFAELLADARARTSEPRWDAGEPTRFGQLARRLWGGAARGRASRTTPVTRPFDVCGPLPTGVTVLEASAGTGKTYTIAALAARYVAEGTPLRRSCCSSPSRAWRPASCATACASGSSAPSGAGARRRRRRRPGRRRVPRCSPTARRTRSSARRDRPRARAGRLRRRDDRHHPRLLPGGARRPRRRRRRRAATRRSSRTSATSSTRSSTTSTSAASTAASAPTFTRARGAADRPRRRRQPGRADRAAHAPGDALPAMRAAARARRCARSSSARKRRWRSSPTTTC